MADMTTCNSMTEEAEFREYVANMTQKRTPEIVKSNPFDRTSPFYTKYLEMVRSAVIKYRSH